MQKVELLKEIAAKKKLVMEGLQNIEETEFNVSKNEKWSQAGHIEHLINSIKPLNQLFLLPKFIMTYWMGKPNRPSRTYKKLVEKYNEKLKTSNPTINRFGPSKAKNYSKQQLLAKFEKQYDLFAKNIENKWTEDALEKYLIPHPLLGKLTVREMIMFTIYHTEHHHNLM